MRIELTRPRPHQGAGSAAPSASTPSANGRWSAGVP
eukprot:CAMPEP_0206018740 /NCGR_PEP_ID=MMETSP1464-20131121/27748_1 /ASSEMBLY_ACC=CAM_ASM_001124 /TAXON_ID=119497 /ORGANISM="Exanthemachrysis gayraliae, Strain RCC1523" /LENGTH=35 /DNA_ID= /DNA_START= /DNA_END= /DNA_ORIENTATION=